MKLLSGILFFAIATVLVESRSIQQQPSHDETTINCLISYLKRHKALESSYPEFQVAKNEFKCGLIVPEIIAGVRERTETFVNTVSNNIKIRRCLNKKLESIDYEKKVLLSVVYDASDSLLPEDQITKLQAEANEAGPKLMKNSLGNCISYVKVEEMFDDIYDFAAENEANSGKKPDTIGDYCTRQFVIDNELVDLKRFNVPINPENLDLEGADCDDIKNKIVEALEELKPRFLGQPSESHNDEIKCIFKKFDEIKFTHKMMGIFMLAKLGINEEQKKIDRKHFAEEVNDATYAKCMTFDFE